MRQQISDIRAAILAGDVVILPTETVYGLATRADNADALYRVKARPGEKRFAHVYASPEDVLNQISHNIYLEMLITRLLPGPFTLILPTPDGSDKGFRVPDHDLCREVVADLGVDVVLTSANMYNELPATNFAAAHQIFPDLLGLDGGICKYSRPSMIINLKQASRL